ncbi:g1984 [Coccomyxa elongata]
MHREARAGGGKLEVAAAENLLGDILRGAGPERAAEAEAAYRSCLFAREKLLGLHHPDVAVALLGLGLAVAADGKQDMARPLLQRSLGLLQRSLGHQHPITVQAATAQSSLLP